LCDCKSDKEKADAIQTIRDQLKWVGVITAAYETAYQKLKREGYYTFSAEFLPKPGRRAADKMGLEIGLEEVLAAQGIKTVVGGSTSGNKSEVHMGNPKGTLSEQIVYQMATVHEKSHADDFDAAVKELGSEQAALARGFSLDGAFNGEMRAYGKQEEFLEEKLSELQGFK
jgi:hypothetical protein